MSDLIGEMNLPWKDKPNRGGLLRTISRIGDIVKADIVAVSRAFHPFLCEPELLSQHGAAVGIPRLGEDTDEGHRERVSTAGFFLGERGQRGQVFAVLDRIIPGRYKIFEAPKDAFRVGVSKLGEGIIGPGVYLVIRVRRLSHLEKIQIFRVLESLLDPDIEIIIVLWKISTFTGLTLGRIRFYGGSRWLATQYLDICDSVRVRLLPDDAFRIGSGRVGHAVVWGRTNGELIRIGCPAGMKTAVSERSRSMYHNSINWEVIDE